jgi:multiple sugar transport system substrate-binding protein
MTGQIGRRRAWRLVPAVVAVAGVLAASACGGSTTSSTNSPAGGAGIPTLSPSTKVTISFLSYNYGSPNLGGAGTQALLDAFHKAYPNITVKPQSVTVADTLTKLKTDTAAGSPPDVAQLGWSKMAEALQTLPITPVQQIPPADEWKSDTAGISASVLSAVSTGGVVKAMPYTVSIPTLFLNADLFRKAGLDPNKPPATFDELKKDALAIKATGAQGAYIGIADDGKSDYLTQSVVNGNGGSLVDKNGDETVDSPAVVSALAAMQDLTQSGAQPAVTSMSAQNSFLTGKLGMLLTSTAVTAGAVKAADGHFELRTGAFPTFGSKPAKPTYSGAGLAVLAKDDVHRRAAWEFIKFLTSDAGFKVIATQIGYLPLRQTVATELADTPTMKLLAPAMQQLDTVTPYTSFKGAQANQAELALQDDGVSPIVLRGADPGKTLGSVADKIRKLTT